MDMDQILEQTLSANFESVLERLLEPIARIERLKRKESLTPDEVELVYGLKASTLANKRTKGTGPEFIRDGDKILYTPRAVKEYLEDKTVRTSGSRSREANAIVKRFKK
jgi:hypothetical protein